MRSNKNGNNSIKIAKNELDNQLANSAFGAID